MLLRHGRAGQCPLITNWVETRDPDRKHTRERPVAGRTRYDNVGKQKGE